MNRQGSPSDHEIAGQLDRIGRSKNFSHADKQAALLSFIVNAALKGEEISEKIIAAELFPPYDPESTIVRTNLSHLRKRLSEYYGKEGRNDPISIVIPQGRAYRPAFGYNGFSLASVGRAHGLYFLERAEIGAAASEFYNLTQSSDYVPAFTGCAQADLLTNVFRPHRKFEPYYVIEKNIAEAVKRNPGNLEAQLLTGAVHACRCQWDAAKTAFDAALEADTIATRNNWWYIYYLLISGDPQLALLLADAKLVQNPASPLTITLAAGIYYLLARYDVAKALLESAFRLNHQFWPMLVTAACVALRTDDRPGAPLNYLISIPSSHESTFPGLRILCLARAGKEKEARLLMEKEMSIFPPMSPVQTALAHLGLGEKQKAVAVLARGRDQVDPLMALLEVWPVFQPLESRRAFQTLLRDMGFPYSR